ncbi:MAG: GMC family oxidoreductase N-terminal domain-containing protein [Steroidobacteraceae bacterium]
MQTADYIIVGAGAAGCVLANRLCADPNRSVLLVESGGPDSSPLIHMPRGFGKTLLDPDLIWVYPTERKQGGKQEMWVRGKTLGGSTSVNGMMYVRGLPGDYDEWEAQGCTGWGSKEMAASFRTIEDHELGPGEWRGTGGPLKVSCYPQRHPLCEAVIEGATQLGKQRKLDVHERPGENFGYNQRTIAGGRRQRAATAFLKPVLHRRNLQVATRTNVQRLIFDGERAVGVQVRDASGSREIRAAREVLLCAGAINTPKLLLVSGIGPADVLARAGVEPRLDVPGIGRDLHEHLLLTLHFRVTHGSENRSFRAPGVALTALRYFLTRSGPFAQAAMDVCGYINTRPDVDRPDAQVMMTTVSLDLTKDGFARIDSKPGFMIGTYPLRPRSRGRLEITSPDPAAPLYIEPNYLSDAEDRRVAVECARFVRRLAQTPALQAFGATELFPGPQVNSDEQIVDAYLQYGNSGYHTVGTCRMGSDPRSVVDVRCRVRGIRNLRVIDASIIPAMVSANTAGPVMAMASRAAQFVLEERE